MTETSFPAAASAVSPAVDNPLVWVDGWQMACCGEQFSIGSEVAWFLEPAQNAAWFESVIGSDPDLQPSLAEEHHSEESAGARAPAARVVRIRAVHCAYQADPGPEAPRSTVVPVPGSTVITELSAASMVDPEPWVGARAGAAGADELAESPSLADLAEPTDLAGDAGFAGGTDPAGAGELSFVGYLVDLRFTHPRKDT